LARRVGRLPARALRLGSDDATTGYLRDLFRGVTDDTWASRDRSEDYLHALEQITIPVAAVLGSRDRIMCHPRSGEAFARRCGGRVAVFHAPVGHMELVTRSHGWPAIIEAVEWAVRG